MKTLEEEPSTTTDDQLETISLPNEIIQEILLRLPVKPLLKLRGVSKLWYSLISDPSFSNLHFNRPTTCRRAALFISAYDKSTRERHFFSAADDGGRVTHLMSLRNVPSSRREHTDAEHLNGLVLYTSGNGFVENNFAFVLNPCTRKIYKLPGPASVPKYTYRKAHICYFFGFDESRNEHKVLTIRMLDIQPTRPFAPATTEFLIFSFSNYSWRKVDAKLPIRNGWVHWYYGTKHSVCVNSVIHVMLQSRHKILMFDLRTEKFSIMNIPQDALPHVSARRYIRRGVRILKSNQPFVMKINGLLGVLCHDRVVETDEMQVWILEDYENRVWVRKTIAFSDSWKDADGPFPLDSSNMDEIVFSPRKTSKSRIAVPIYDMKTGSFKSAKFYLGHEFFRSKTMVFDQVKCYVKSIMPLKENETMGFTQIWRSY